MRYACKPASDEDVRAALVLRNLADDLIGNYGFPPDSPAVLEPLKRANQLNPPTSPLPDKLGSKVRVYYDSGTFYDGVHVNHDNVKETFWVDMNDGYHFTTDDVVAWEPLDDLAPAPKPEPVRTFTPEELRAQIDELSIVERAEHAGGWAGIVADYINAQLETESNA